ncbi:hypothetical protein EWM64_g3490 [Hericium alpestre]|uniref:Glycoside hydrolase family 31 N-terminal domain-containing protein n=1 Tax=Hericium alpestre TaxID=135208 RepID=A0A4Z0A3S6_9AGAM|nr:hypothetical protein EWM64_g3490 [Hericium alpestre]
MRPSAACQRAERNEVDSGTHLAVRPLLAEAVQRLVLVAELAGGVLAFYRLEADGVRTLLTQEYTDDKALPARYYTQEFRASSFAAQFAFSSDVEEMMFGVGQQACCRDSTVNKKGQVVDLLNFNSQVPIPVFMSSKGYLIFFKYPGQGRMEFGQYRTRFVAEEVTVVDYYITTAPVGDYDALQQQYTAVTGRQPTPPDFLIGYQQSKLRYFNQTHVLDVAQRFHDEGINLALLVVDFFAWKYQGDWSFDSSLWPDPAGMVTEVKRLTGAEMMVSLWPSVEDLWLEHHRHYQQAIDEGHHNLTDTPAGATECKYMSLTRSTFAGGQRFCSYMWSGDTMSRFDVLLQQITAGVSVTASGISSWTLDIGGFTGLNVESAYGRQLFVRWIAMGTFLPFMRVHGNRQCSLSGPSDIFSANSCPNEVWVSSAFYHLVTQKDTQPWAYGEENFPIVKNYISERYKLVPYVKKLFQQLQATGRSIMRPLYYDFSLSDPIVVNGTRANDGLVTHQFMLGPRILVSPVGIENATSKDVYLPILNQEQKNQGWTWQHWWTGKDYGMFYLGNKEDILSGNI